MFEVRESGIQESMQRCKCGVRPPPKAQFSFRKQKSGFWPPPQQGHHPLFLSMPPKNLRHLLVVSQGQKWPKRLWRVTLVTSRHPVAVTRPRFTFLFFHKWFGIAIVLIGTVAHVFTVAKTLTAIDRQFMTRCNATFFQQIRMTVVEQSSRVA